MSGLFNKTFFKFLIGFFAIIAASFLILATLGYYETEASGSPNAPSPDFIQAAGGGK